MTKKAISIGADPGIKTVQGNGRRISVTTSPSATATSTMIAINLAAHFKLSRLIFIVASVCSCTIDFLRESVRRLAREDVPWITLPCSLIACF